ncbi:hypothetical protein HH308_20270 [Gordonia sp. TBRC 11910]|uniref:FAD-binding domain-containing protein n=1 Tax=Gordonia asplenii TaxID=2725283 RepID=A0A848KY89_9ACTN|nr:FAD-dependent monooxygenase [Gordonia asplenii]NMO03556.1 hypothetical protein [Gordonia asplenii]
MEHTELLVVGGGPVGLSAALWAAKYGLKCVLVERHENPYHHPKARGVRTRAMELFGLLGVGEELRALAPADPEYGFVYCETLAGAEYGRTPAGGASFDQSPTSDTRIAQDQLETVLRRTVAERGGVVTRYGTAVEDIEQDDSGVSVTVVDTSTGARNVITADYVIAADGANSATRKALGIDCDGVDIGFWQSVYWHGDLAGAIDGRAAIQYLTADPEGGFVTVAPVDGHSRWVTFRMRGRDGHHPGQLTPEESRALIARAVGRDVNPEIISTATYLVSATVARQYRSGRVFLAGDAAHTFPPTGGFGLNTGVGDVHNLLWKIALTASGAASDALLDTYEAERRPIAQSNASWSADNAARFDAVWENIASGESPGDPITRQKAHLLAIQRDLGFRYGVADDYRELDLTAKVGRRAPYLRVTSYGEPTSSLHLFDGRITLLHRRDGGAWTDAARLLNERLKFPIEVVEVGAREFEVDEQAFADSYSLANESALLIRPDGHIAWRSDDQAGVELNDAVAALLVL